MDPSSFSQYVNILPELELLYVTSNDYLGIHVVIIGFEYCDNLYYSGLIGARGAGRHK